MKNRILYITRSLEIGGLERVIVLLANHINDKHFEPYICCTSLVGKMGDSLKDKEKLFVIGEKRISIRGYSYIYKLVKENSIDLIHSHELPALLFGLPVAKLARIPIVYTKHGYKPHKERKVTELIGRLFSKRVSEYICVSGELRDRMIVENGLDSRKVSVIYNGVEPPAEKVRVKETAKKKIVIGSVGRLEKVKNYSLLISAFSEILKKYQDCRLEIVGGGSYRNKLLDYSKKLSITDHVNLPGYHLDVQRFLDTFDIFVISSIFEGHSISLLEALSRGKICIVSNVGGNTEIIKDGVNGFVFKSGSKYDLIDKISMAIENLNSEQMQSIKANAVETYQSKFSVGTMVNKHEELYRKLIRG